MAPRLKKKQMIEYSAEFFAAKDNIPAMKDFLLKHLSQWQVSEEKQHDIILAADEAATNIIMHAYGLPIQGGDVPAQEKQFNDKKFKIILRKNEHLVQVVLEDHGSNCDLRQIPLPDIKTYLNQKKQGGFGVALMKVLMDKISYHCKNGKNMTKLVKRI